MRQRFLIILTAIILLPLRVVAADTLTVEKKLLSEYSRTAVFRNQVWQNAAIRFEQRPFSLTSVSVKGLYEQRGDAALAQEGNRRKDFSAEVNSFVVLNPRNRLSSSSLRLWEDTKTVIFRSATSAIKILQICLRITGSSPSTGSSKISRSGLQQIASQNATCFCMPFDSRLIVRFTSIVGKNSCIL